MKKILIFSLAYYPRHVSGAEAAIKELTDRISPETYEFHMITHRFDSHDMSLETIGNVHIHRVGLASENLGYISKILFVPLAVYKARQLHHMHHFDMLWAMMTYMLFPTVLAQYCGVRIPHILTLQDGDSYEKVFGRLKVRLVRPIIDYGFRNARVIQVISKYLGTWPMLRGSNAPVVLIHNGANPRDLKEQVSNEAIAAIKEKFNKKSEDVWLVNTARLVHQKGNDTTIRALRLLPDNIKLLLVGGGEDEEMLRNVAKEEEVADRIMFAGNVDRSIVSAYRKASDIFVAPSRSEGLGNAFLSAMASRLPVVATQAGGLADFIFDEIHNPEVAPTGWVVKADSPESIAAAVKDILAHPDKVKMVTETARAMVVRDYDWDIIANEMKTKVFDIIH
jgi:glycosyltransferase involved in cell wall biosynthesis